MSSHRASASSSAELSQATHSLRNRFSRNLSLQGVTRLGDGGFIPVSIRFGRLKRICHGIVGLWTRPKLVETATDVPWQVSIARNADSLQRCETLKRGLNNSSRI